MADCWSWFDSEGAYLAGSLSYDIWNRQNGINYGSLIHGSYHHIIYNTHGPQGLEFWLTRLLKKRFVILCEIRAGETWTADHLNCLLLPEGIHIFRSQKLSQFMQILTRRGKEILLAQCEHSPPG